MAALVGASLMAISAFFIHKRSVDQVLDRLITIRRKSVLKSHRKGKEEEIDMVDNNNYDEDEEYGSDGELMRIDRKMCVSRSLDDNRAIPSYRISSSMPNAVLNNDWFDEESMRFGPGARGEDNNLNFIPSGLPPLHTVPREGDGKTLNYSSSVTRMTSIGRLMTPRSPSGNAFEYSVDSEEEGTALADEDAILYSQTVDSSADYTNVTGMSAFEKNTQQDVDSKIQNPTVLQFSGVDSTYSVPEQNIGASVEQHGDGKVHATSVQRVGNNPPFATMILPQRTSVPGEKKESINVEEKEVRKMICECLDLRNRYVYAENVAPWMKQAVEQSTASGVNTNLFEPFPATTHCFRMEDGVVHVYASEHDTIELFPVASATAFFTDMHHLLRIVSLGNVRSACYHRLRFLEEKFRLHLLVNADRESLVQKSAPHRDFYNIRKVDTHVHHSACMNQKHLLRFIKSKLRKEPDEVVIFRDGKYMTLKEVFESLDLTGYVLPRLYNVYKQMGTVNSFQNILDNVFIPLFEVTINPSSHPQLHVFLMQVVGLDIVDDESRPERRPTKHMPKPAEWTNEFNPAYSYYAYYCYANLYTLNKAGDIDHLAAAFLLCNNISHGINLRKSPVLQYLYYLAQRGLNVSLSTDDPLQIHLTKEPLVEEYSVAAKVWKLSACDLCEIARNSVYQSGFSHAAKLGDGIDDLKSDTLELRLLSRMAAVTFSQKRQRSHDNLKRMQRARVGTAATARRDEC
ncbi:unnamed protein product [Dovyalis caffra]|uniref:AMP deaminase n=1 Tax=Dovyalis caffra TaxID=77055 RepID=A0AAV1RFQ2_9ROSI|nr:unnamed protein product [Dovyalis caffra]